MGGPWQGSLGSPVCFSPGLPTLLPCPLTIHFRVAGLSNEQESEAMQENNRTPKSDTPSAPITSELRMRRRVAIAERRAETAVESLGTRIDELQLASLFAIAINHTDTTDEERSGAMNAFERVSRYFLPEATFDMERVTLPFKRTVDQWDALDEQLMRQAENCVGANDTKH